MHDYLIIGQGLAGSLLAYELAKCNQSVCVIDNQHKTSSSRVAAGLINPLAGKRLALAPNTTRLLSHAISSYQEFENIAGLSFWHELDMLRILNSEEQKEFFISRQSQTDYQPFLGEYISSDNLPSVQTPFGACIQKQCGYVDLPSLLRWLHDWLNKHQRIEHGHISYQDIQLHSASVTVNNIEARQLVFCEGFVGMHNPWFDFLAYQPAKGEILDLEIHNPVLPDTIINSGYWLIPLGSHRYRFGATNDWANLNATTTVAAREELTTAFEKLFPGIDYHLLDQTAGVRPASQDRIPFIGTHPEYAKLTIMNGFGARGCLSIPFYANHLAQHLVEKTALDFHSNITRYAK